MHYKYNIYTIRAQRKQCFLKVYSHRDPIILACTSTNIYPVAASVPNILRNFNDEKCAHFEKNWSQDEDDRFEMILLFNDEQNLSRNLLYIYVYNSKNYAKKIFNSNLLEV